MPLSIKNIIRHPLLRLAVSLGILTTLSFFLPIKVLWNAIRQISLPIWLLTFVVFISGHLLGVFKWRMLINGKKLNISFGKTARFYFAGLFANLYLPSLVGGDVVRASLAIRESRQPEQIIWGGLVDRFFDVISLTLLILFGSFFGRVGLAHADQNILLVVLLFCAAFIAAIPILFLSSSRFERFPNLQKKMSELKKVIHFLIQSPQIALVALLIALMMQSSFVLINAMLGTMCGIHLPIAVWFLVWPLAKLSALVPITFGGLGVREAALAVVIGRFSVSPALAVGLGLLWQSVLVTGGLAGGLLYLVSGEKKTKLSTLLSSNQS